MDIIQLCATSFIIAFSGAASPGTVTLTILKESIDKGTKVGFLFSIGHALIEIPIVLILFFGLGPALLRPILPLLGVIGGIFLIALGFLTIDTGLRFRPKAQESKPKEGGGSLELTALGATLSVSNPYWILWWLTIGATYIISSIEFGLFGLISFYLSHIAADFIVFIGLAMLVSRGQNMIGQKGYRMMLLVCGLFLILFGANTILGTTIS